MRTRHDDMVARDALAPLEIAAPPLRSYFDRLMDFARLADWGRKPIERHRTFVTPERRPGAAAERIARRSGLRTRLAASPR
jgi:hypothetical protein